jgi:chromosome segregation ATPase
MPFTFLPTAFFCLQMYANARAQASTAQDLQRHITEAMASKAEWESKVAVLQQELQALANATPELLEQLQYEVEELKGAVAVSEAEKRAFEDQTAGLRASKAQLEERVKTVKDELKTAQACCCSHLLVYAFCTLLRVHISAVALKERG